MLGNIAYLAAGLGAGICVVGGALGLGKLSAAAMDGTARQPAAGEAIRTSMLLSGTLIEGATLLGLVVCILLAIK